MSTVAQEVKTFRIDPSHSRLGFSVRHMGFSRVRGGFGDFRGLVRMADGDIESLQAEGVAKTSTISTGDVRRDEHLRSADFFDVEEYPEISFRSSSARVRSGDSFTLEGDLTMHGVTRTIELDAAFLGAGIDPWGGTRVAFEARTTLQRKEFGLNWNAVLETGGLLVSDEVEVVLEIQAVESDQDE